MIDTILLPLDGSERAASAIPPVLRIAGAFDARVILHRVVCKGDSTTGAFPPDPSEWQLGRGEAKAYLETVRRRFEAAGIPAEVLVTVGCPAHEIVEAAEREGAQLVAITTHGAGGESPFPISGTATKVLQGAPTSVLLLPAMTPVPWSGSLRRIVVPLDGSPRGEWALRAALVLARRDDGEVLAVHVIRPPALEVPGSDPELASLAEQYTARSRLLARRYLDRLADRLGARDVPVETEVLVDPNVCHAVIELAEREAAGLIVVSAHGSGAARETCFGTVPRALVDRSGRPVLILQDVPGPRADPAEAIRSEGRWEIRPTPGR